MGISYLYPICYNFYLDFWFYYSTSFYFFFFLIYCSSSAIMLSTSSSTSAESIFLICSIWSFSYFWLIAISKCFYFTLSTSSASTIVFFIIFWHSPTTSKVVESNSFNYKESNVCPNNFLRFYSSSVVFFIALTWPNILLALFWSFYAILFLAYCNFWLYYFVLWSIFLSNISIVALNTNLLFST